MRKIMLISLLLLPLNTGTFSAQMEMDELTGIADYITEKNMAVNSWQVTVKEQIDGKKLRLIIKDLEAEHQTTFTEDENSINYLFSNRHKHENIVESYSIIIPKDDSQAIILTGVLKGEAWNDSVKDFYQLSMDKMLAGFFTKSAKRFACLTTEDDGIMGSDYFIGDFVKSFNLQQINTQFDTVKNSVHKKIIYGYTPLWNNKITIMGKPVNLQIAVKESETGNPIFTIGTPILINEY